MADNFYWPEEHQRVLDIFQAKHNEGTDVFYISGNHDDPLRDKGLINKLKLKDDTHKKIIEVLDEFKHKEKHDFMSKFTQQVTENACISRRSWVVPTIFGRKSWGTTHDLRLNFMFIIIFIRVRLTHQIVI